MIIRLPMQEQRLKHTSEEFIEKLKILLAHIVTTLQLKRITLHYVRVAPLTNFRTHIWGSQSIIDCVLEKIY